MSAQKPFDYALARNNIVKLREIRVALETELDGAHTDIADLREQLARAERERDAARKDAESAYARAQHWKSVSDAQLAEAKREGAREALTRLAYSWDNGCAVRGHDSADILQYADRHYPAPSPAAAPTREPERTPWQLPVFTETHGELSHQYVEITPEAAAAILRLAAQHGEG